MKGLQLQPSSSKQMMKHKDYLLDRANIILNFGTYEYACHCDAPNVIMCQAFAMIKTVKDRTACAFRRGILETQ